MIAHITLRGHSILVYQVESAEEAKQGLTGQVIDDDEALMLPAEHGIHTMGVPHALDLVWFSKDGETTAIDENIQPGLFVQAKGPFVMELRGGWFQRHPQPQQVAAANLSMSMEDVSDEAMQQIIALHTAMHQGGCLCKKSGGCAGCAERAKGAGGQNHVTGQALAERRALVHNLLVTHGLQPAAVRR